MRSWLRHLAASDRLAVARPRLSLEFELAAVATRLEGRQACWFPEPGGHTIPVVAGFTGNRAWMAEAMVSISRLTRRTHLMMSWMSS